MAWRAWRRPAQCGSAQRWVRSLTQVTAADSLGSPQLWQHDIRKLAFTPPAGDPLTESRVEALADFISGAQGRLVCLTGAGCSTESGVPDYRSPEGSYSKGHQPQTHSEFVKSPVQRARYWARSLRGWRYFNAARPNVTHHALAALEQASFVQGLITQNVDGLHQEAGMQHVVDLHGRNNEVECHSCHFRQPRVDFQLEIEAVNGPWIEEHLPISSTADLRADGDAHLDVSDFRGFVVPPCPRCGGFFMPRVVFFGGALKPEDAQAAASMVESGHSLLVLGSSCHVFSAFRLVRQAATAGQPLALVNIGGTRISPLLDPQMHFSWRCGDALTAVCARLGVQLGET